MSCISLSHQLLRIYSTPTTCSETHLIVAASHRFFFFFFWSTYTAWCTILGLQVFIKMLNKWFLPLINLVEEMRYTHKIIRTVLSQYIFKLENNFQLAY